tara:strand:+ start:731 stop:1096 length:366 start_codon:yes stop_codon:yes gene_type:complete
MTSVLNVDTIAAKDGTSPVGFTKQTAAKQTIQYAGATNSIEGSFNTSSVTDNGTGNFTINYTNNFSSNGTQSSTSSVFAVSSQDRTHQYGAMSTSTILMVLMQGGSLIDIVGYGAVFGDLA